MKISYSSALRATLIPADAGMTSKVVLVLASLFLLSACDHLPDWAGGAKKKEAPLPGERVNVLPKKEDIVADSWLGQIETKLPDAEANAQWTQDGGNAQNALANPAFSGQMTQAGSASVGEGKKWKNDVLIPAPVIAEGKVFAMDAEGAVSAHDAANIGRIVWTSKAAITKDEPEVIGGGLAYDNGTLFATTGRGLLVAIEAATGKERWRKLINIPLRSAPRVSDNVVYAVSVDNQTFAYNAQSGALLWSHRGINESAGYLSMVSPAVDGSFVVSPYSSGEMFAINAKTGEVFWSDSLIRANRTSATSLFTGINANPVIAGGIVYGVSNGGVLAANNLGTGKRLWEQKVSSRNTPWLAGDYLFVISSDNEVVCLHAPTGRIKWVQKLPESGKKESFTWSGPTLAGSRLYIAGSHGVMLALSPDNGTTLATVSIPEGVYNGPVVAGGVMYFVSRNAILTAYK